MQIKEILKWLSDNHYHYSFRGNEDDEVLGFASLQTCTPGKMTWEEQKCTIRLRPVQSGEHILVDLEKQRRISVPFGKNGVYRERELIAERFRFFLCDAENGRVDPHALFQFHDAVAVRSDLGVPGIRVQRGGRYYGCQHSFS